jgi:hypothetical protein
MTIKTKPTTKQFNSNFEKIFGSEEDRVKKREAEKTEFEKNWRYWEMASLESGNKSANVQKNLDEFKSPIDGSIISCRSQLRDHNKKHGVTDIRDYGHQHFETRGKEMYREKTGDNPQAKKERQQLIEHNLYKYGVLK